MDKLEDKVTPTYGSIVDNFSIGYSKIFSELTMSYGIDKEDNSDCKETELKFDYPIFVKYSKYNKIHCYGGGSLEVTENCDNFTLTLTIKNQNQETHTYTFKRELRDLDKLKDKFGDLSKLFIHCRTKENYKNNNVTIDRPNLTEFVNENKETIIFEDPIEYSTFPPIRYYSFPKQYKKNVLEIFEKQDFQVTLCN
jgi:hypothetical protein